MDEDKEIYNRVIDELYRIYQAEIMMQNIAYIHPMFYNGTFSENNSYVPPEPEVEMTREEFEKAIADNGEKYRWTTAFQALFSYIKRYENR